MGNRKQPFGYKMELGAVVIQPSEAMVVQRIYERYSQGDSYAALVHWLKEQPVPYMPGKLWNKNMVARILEDERYIGTQDYPVIVEKAAAELAAAKRRSKQDGNARKTDVQKLLRQLSGSKVTERMERSVLELLNGLIASPERIQAQPDTHTNAPEIRKLEQELDQLLAQMPVDAETAEQLSFKLAAEQYAALGDSGYETERLKRLLGKEAPMDALDVGLVRNIVSKIEVQGDGAFCLQLKNGQLIAGRREHGSSKRKDSDRHPGKSGSGQSGTGQTAAPGSGILPCIDG